MRRLLLALLILASFAPAAVIAQETSTSGAAPADRYFGRMRMSILGIRNTLADAGTKLDVDQANRSAVFHKVVLADEAMHDWAAQYPHDPWLPRYIYALAQLYRRLPGDEARTFMNDTIDWLVTAFPASNEAHLARDFVR